MVPFKVVLYSLVVLCFFALAGQALPLKASIIYIFMMASLLLGTGGTALLLAFFKITKEAYYINLALGFALHPKS